MNPTMAIHLVIDADTLNAETHEFTAEYGIQDIRWEAFRRQYRTDGDHYTVPDERKFSQQDAYVGADIYPALFLNTNMVKPQIVCMLPDGRLYVSVVTL